MATRSDRRSQVALTATEVGMLVYWLFAGLMAAEVISVDPSLMYSNHQDPTIVDWNWSFLPLDVGFALLGLSSRYGQLRPEAADTAAITGLALMFCAGLMAVSFWALQGSFDPLWWGLNGWLMLLSGSILARRLFASGEGSTSGPGTTSPACGVAGRS